MQNNFKKIIYIADVHEIQRETADCAIITNGFAFQLTMGDDPEKKKKAQMHPHLIYYH